MPSQAITLFNMLITLFNMLNSVNMPWEARRWNPRPWIQRRGYTALESKVLGFGQWICVPGSMALDPGPVYSASREPLGEESHWGTI